MQASDRLVRVLVSKAARLEHTPEIDRHAVDSIGDVPDPTPPVTPSAPSNPKEAMLREIGTIVASGSASTDGDVFDAVLDGPHLTPVELRGLLRQPGLTPAQRGRILRHPRTPGDLIIDHVCDARHDTGLFGVEALREQIALLQRATGITAHQRLTAWSTLLLRAARSPATLEHLGDVLIASPNATTVLHDATERSLATTRHIPDALGAHLLSHLCAPATIARLPLPVLFRIVDRAELSGASSDRLLDVICDLVAASCSTDPARWARMFALARDWDGNLDKLLDTVESAAASENVVLLRRRHTPAYQRDARSPVVRVTGS